MASGILHPYHAEDSEPDEENEAPIHKRRKLHTWILKFTFANSELAKEHVADGRIFTYNTTVDLDSGRKSYYVCKHKECPAKLHLHFLANSQLVDLYENEDAHDHSRHPLNGIPPAVKEKISLHVSNGHHFPKKIQALLREQGMQPPSRTQIANFVSYGKAKAGAVVSMGALNNLCENNEPEPQDQDEAFVIGSTFDFEKKSFQFTMSSRRLLGIADKAQCLHADATYKLTWEGFPVIIMGTSDADRRFHPLLISVATNEAEDDYYEIFSHLSNRTTTFHPKGLVADAANAISNAAFRVFGNTLLRVHCWFHVSKKFKDKLNLTPTDDVRKTIHRDLSFLQLACSPQEFEVGKSLWLKKWNNGATAAFAQYVESEYFIQRSNWYEGYAPGYPKTNNGLEAVNGTIKKENTLRNRLVVGEFFAEMKKIVHGWSCDRDPNAAGFLPFVTKPSMNLKLNTAGFEWATDKSRHPVRSRQNEELNITYFIPANGSKPLTETDINSYVNRCARLSWKKFDTYLETKQRLWVVQYDGQDWIKSTCSCPIFSKAAICKHIVGVAITRKDYEVPPQAKTVPLGEKRKRGRPAKAKKALLVN